MKLTVACLSIASCVPSLSLPVKFTAKDCGGKHYIQSTVVPSQPHTGELFKVTSHFDVGEDILGGQFDVKVTAMGGIRLKHQTGPLCGIDTSYKVYLAVVKVATVTIYGSVCPIPKGPLDIRYDITLASILPPKLGNAAFHLTAKNQQGTDLFCAEAHLGIAAEDSAKITTESNTGSSIASADMDTQVTSKWIHNGLPVKFTAEDCGGGHYRSFDVLPLHPRTGETFKVTNYFQFDADVFGGQFDVKVTALGGIPLKHQTGPLCGADTTYDVHLALVKVATVTVHGSQCPLQRIAGIHYDIKLASILPPALGNAAFHFSAKNEKGADILCVKAHLMINAEESSAATVVV